MERTRFGNMKGTQARAERIELVEFRREDIPRLIGWIRSPEDLSAWAGAFFTYPLDEAILERYQDSGRGERPQRRLFKALAADSGEAVGHIELSHIWPYLSGRVSRVLVGDPALRGRGIGTRMVRALVQQAFAEYGFAHLDLGVDAANRRAIACYQRAGFVHVGTWPRAMKTAAGVIDVYWMSITRPGRSRPE
jgi:RimJ/RimL family protein N-acetyltransferase